MPKLPHEALVQLVRDAPETIVRLAWPESQLAARVHVAAGEFVDLNLAEYHADTVLMVGDSARPSRSVIVEVQTAVDPRKRRSWAVYVAGLHARHDCAVDLVVLALDREVARWAGTPIMIGERRAGPASARAGGAVGRRARARARRRAHCSGGADRGPRPRQGPRLQVS